MKYLSKAKRIIVILLVIVLMVPILNMEIMAKSTKPVKLGKPSSIKTSVVNNKKAKISWKKVKKATKYEVYRTENKKKKYTKIKTTSSRSYVDKKVNAGKKYYYKVRAYRKDGNRKVYGKFSKVKSVVIPKKAVDTPTPRPTLMPTSTPTPVLRPTSTPIPIPTLTPTPKFHTVIFEDDEWGVLKMQMVEHGGAALAPFFADSRYVFDGWDKPFDNVTKDLVINAKWTERKDPILQPDIKERLIMDFWTHMKGDYPSLQLEDVGVEKYYGTYSGCEVAFMEGTFEYAEAVREVDIAGYTFYFPSDQPLFIYNASSFMAIEDAYEVGWIDAEDVKSIWDKLPIGYIASLQPDIEERLIIDYWTYWKDRVSLLQPKDIWVSGYYGTYSGCEIVYMDSYAIPYTQSERNVDIANYIFKIADNHLLLVHKGYSFMAINDAYEAGWISADDVKLIWDKYKAHRIY